MGGVDANDFESILFMCTCKQTPVSFLFFPYSTIQTIITYIHNTCSLVMLLYFFLHLLTHKPKFPFLPCQICRYAGMARRQWQWRRGRTSASRAGWTPSPTRSCASRGFSTTPSTPWKWRVTASRWRRDTASWTTPRGKCPVNGVCLLGCLYRGVS